MTLNVHQLMMGNCFGILEITLVTQIWDNRANAILDMVHQRKYVLEGRQKLWIPAVEAPTFLKSQDPGALSTGGEER